MLPPAPSPPAPPQPPPPTGGWFPRAITLWERRLLALLLALFILRELPWRLDEYDQAKQAFTSLEMIDGGAWWFQHTPGCRGLATKPPLVGWMSAAIYELCGGHWDLAWRLPSLLAAMAMVVLLWRAGERLWPRWGGTLAAAAFGFNALTPRLATLVRTDAVLALWTTLLGLIIWQHVRDGGKAWTTRARWEVFVLMLATLMTKGPIVYAFLLPGMAVHWWVSRRRGERASLVWGGWWHWTLPLLPFLVWLERGIVTVPGFREEVIGHEFLGRFTVGEHAIHHNQAVWFYAAQLLARWLPWSVLLLAVGLRARGVWKTSWSEAGTRWLLCWAVGGLVALSLVPSKRTDRIFPVVPPLCLVLTAIVARAQKQTEAEHAAAGQLVRLPQEALWPRQWGSWTVAASALLATAATLIPVAHAYLRHDAARADFGERVRTTSPGRYELVVGKGWTAEEESMLIYLRRLRFLRPVDAVQLASTGKLDAMVINEQALNLDRNKNMLTPYFSPKAELVIRRRVASLRFVQQTIPHPAANSRAGTNIPAAGPPMIKRHSCSEVCSNPALMKSLAVMPGLPGPFTPGESIP